MRTRKNRAMVEIAVSQEIEEHQVDFQVLMDLCCKKTEVMHTRC
jgi:hypothetical protein